MTLGRVALLPTILSHALAGWWLGGAGRPWGLLGLWLGTACLYLGGACLNDACDAEFDAAFRRQRPVPSGAIGLRSVWLLSLSLLGLGLFFLAFYRRETVVLALLFVGVTGIFNATHRLTVVSPLLLALARFLLYVIGASTATHGITGLTLWSGLALAFYATAVLYFKQVKRPSDPPPIWALLPLIVPFPFAWLVNGTGFRWRCAGISLLVLTWILLCLQRSFATGERNVVYTARGLTAGLVLVDFLAVAPENLGAVVLFLPLFLAVLVLQRLQPVH
jgi:hypothetical protein